MTALVAWTRAHLRLVLVGAAIVVLGLAAYCRATSTPIPPKEQTTIDSLKGTKPDFQGRVDTLIKRETTFVAISRHERQGATTTQARADSLRRLALVADSAARAQGDSSSRWFASAQAWHRAADSLGVAVIHLSNAYIAESTARVSADGRAEEYRRRLTATTELNDRLAKDLRRADAPCRVAFVLRCPSRKAAYVVGVLTIPAVRVAANLAQGKSTFSGVLR